MAELTLLGARNGDAPGLLGPPNEKPTCAALDWFAVVFLESPNKLPNVFGVFAPEGPD